MARLRIMENAKKRWQWAIFDDAGAALAGSAQRFPSKAKCMASLKTLRGALDSHITEAGIPTDERQPPDDPKPKPKARKTKPDPKPDDATDNEATATTPSPTSPEEPLTSLPDSMGTEA